MELRRHCERHDCRKLYAPSDSNQKHCSPNCSKITMARRARNKKRNQMAEKIYLLVQQYNRREIDGKELSYQIHQLGKY